MKTHFNRFNLVLGKVLLLLGLVLAISSQTFAQSKLLLGASMGIFNGVTAYSNGSSGRTSTVYNYQFDSSTGTNYKVGYKWQCVEYCNRYYFQVYQKKIRGTGGNAVDYFTTAASRGLVAYPNGGLVPPALGDIMCFSNSFSDGSKGNGHVSICRSVTSSTVNVCQQNVTCTTRDINFPHTMVAQNGTYTVSGSSLGKRYLCQGWLRNPSTQPLPSIVTSPMNNSTFTSDQETFVWNSINGANEYWLALGTTTGGYDLWSESVGMDTSTSFTGLPMDGSKLYVRLFTKINTVWVYSDSTYTCFLPQVVQSNPGEIYFPSNGDILVGPEPLFQWNSDPDTLEYFFYMGNSFGSNDIYGQSTGSKNFVNLIGVPRDGRVLYVRLWIRKASGWTSKDYTYRARNW